MFDHLWYKNVELLTLNSFKLYRPIAENLFPIKFIFRLLTIFFRFQRAWNKHQKLPSRQIASVPMSYLLPTGISVVWEQFGQNFPSLSLSWMPSCKTEANWAKSATAAHHQCELEETVSRSSLRGVALETRISFAADFRCFHYSFAELKNWNQFRFQAGSTSNILDDDADAAYPWWWMKGNLCDFHPPQVPFPFGARRCLASVAAAAREVEL